MRLQLSSNLQILPLIAAAFAVIAGWSQAADHGDTFASATSVTHGNTSGTIDSTSDVDVFRFTVTRTGMVALFTMGNADTLGRIYDSAGNYTGYYSDNSGANYNFQFVQKFQPGTYYLAVSHGGNLTGAYTLGVRMQERSPTITGATRSASFSQAGDIDFFRVKIEQKGVCDFFTTGPVDTVGRLYDNAGGYTGYYSDDSGADYNFHILRQAYGPGEYLLGVRYGGDGNATGGYTVQVRRPGLASRVAGTGARSRQFNVKGDVDLFKIEVPENGEIHLYSSGSTDTSARLYDYTGNYTGYYSDNSGSGYNFSIRRHLTAGTYYLRVFAGSVGVTGPYQLNVIMPDNRRPQINFTSPRWGAKLRGTVTIRGRATDNSLISRVSVYVGGRWHSATRSGPSWHKRIRTPRSGRRYRKINIYARASDFSGNVTTTRRMFRTKR